jgi:CBS domain containing-hemolysin-like protein
MSLSPSGLGRRTHLVPTHIRTPEQLLTLAGVSLSVRQFLLMVVGAALSYRVWLALSWLTVFPAAPVMRWGLTVLPAFLALIFAFVRLAGRDLAVWCLVVLRFSLRPRYFVWHSIRFHDVLGGIQDERGES